VTAVTAAEALASARRLGIVLSFDGRDLHFKAPAGVMTSALRAALIAHKTGIIDLLISEASATAPTPAPAPPPWRAVLATWDVPRRERWGRRANALQDDGLGWREAERRAFLEMTAGPPPGPPALRIWVGPPGG
jgi:hypothetical protein